MGVAVEKETNGVKTRIVAFGDPDFCNNTFVDTGADLDLFMNSVNWLAEKEELNGIRSRDTSQSALMLSPALLRFVFLFFVVLVPLFFLGFGLWSYLRRRR
jgi:ABC-2 type transport system permease protein